MHAYNTDKNSSYMQGPAAAPPLIRAALHSDSANSFTEGALNTPGQSLSMIGRHGIDIAGIHYAFVMGRAGGHERESDRRNYIQKVRQIGNMCARAHTLTRPCPLSTPPIHMAGNTGICDLGDLRVPDSRSLPAGGNPEAFAPLGSTDQEGGGGSGAGEEQMAAVSAACCAIVKAGR